MLGVAGVADVASLTGVAGLASLASLAGIAGVTASPAPALLSSATMPGSTPEQHKAVVDVVVRCAAAFDRREWEALDEVFTVDATAYGVEGRDAAVRFVRGFLGGCGPSQHLLGNHHVVVDGESAKSVCKARVFHVGAGDRSHLTYECFGNYWDDLVLTDSGWRIATRAFEVTITLGDASVLQPG